jgi:hypothetical protein
VHVDASLLPALLEHTKKISYEIYVHMYLSYCLPSEPSTDVLRPCALASEQELRSPPELGHHPSRFERTGEVQSQPGLAWSRSEA